MSFGPAAMLVCDLLISEGLRSVPYSNFSVATYKKRATDIRGCHAGWQHAGLYAGSNNTKQGVDNKGFHSFRISGRPAAAVAQRPETCTRNSKLQLSLVCTLSLRSKDVYGEKRIAGYCNVVVPSSFACNNIEDRLIAREIVSLLSSSFCRIYIAIQYRITIVNILDYNTCET